MFEGFICVYKSNVDLFFYVVGSLYENEVSLNNFIGMDLYLCELMFLLILNLEFDDFCF